MASAAKTPAKGGEAPVKAGLPLPGFVPAPFRLLLDPTTELWTRL